jgi:serine/threonine protein kinase
MSLLPACAALQSALTEVRVLDMLSHPNVIAYYDSFVEDKALMIVMEYASGGTIFEYLQERRGELLEEREIMSLFLQLMLAMQAVHRHNVLHRDLKTQNIMLDSRNALKIVKLGDFGISKVLSSKSKANTVIGTPCYISPELCEGKPYNQKSDIWALGCILYADLCIVLLPQSAPILTIPPKSNTQLRAHDPSPGF